MFGFLKWRSVGSVRRRLLIVALLRLAALLVLHQHLIHFRNPHWGELFRDESMPKWLTCVNKLSIMLAVFHHERT